MACTLSVFSFDIGGAERILRRFVIADDAVEAYVGAPAAALASMLSVGGTQPNGFRITDGRGRVRVTHTDAGRMRWLTA